MKHFACHNWNKSQSEDVDLKSSFAEFRIGSSTWVIISIIWKSSIDGWKYNYQTLLSRIPFPFIRRRTSLFDRTLWSISNGASKHFRASLGRNTLTVISFWSLRLIYIRKCDHFRTARINWMATVMLSKDIKSVAFWICVLNKSSVISSGSQY